MCIQFDLSQSLPPSLIIDGLEQKIAYEGVHSLCFSYGKIGHKKHQCPSGYRLEQPPPSIALSGKGPNIDYGE
ncbi:hypothetical protein SLA2020_287240 [Shorea laevis]